MPVIDFHSNSTPGLIESVNLDQQQLEVKFLYTSFFFFNKVIRSTTLYFVFRLSYKQTNCDAVTFFMALILALLI